MAAKKSAKKSAKFERCVKAVKKSGSARNPWAACHASLGKKTRRDPMEPILTDQYGRPIPKPKRSDFRSDVEFIRAIHAYNDRITNIANRAFAEGFRRESARATGKRRESRRDPGSGWRETPEGKRFYYHIPKLTRGEYATLEWLADRGYDGGILSIAGVEEEYSDGSVQLGDLREHKAWEFKENVYPEELEGDMDESFLASSGSDGLNQKLLDLLEEIT